MEQFFYGVIEGFYGRQWSWQDRTDYAGFLKTYGFDCYIYAPKGDLSLRSHWREPFSAEHVAQLLALAESYHRVGLRWGIGLSPLGLSEQFTEQDKRYLVEKVEAINRLRPDILCILFDDMRGDVADLASRQLSIIETVMASSRVAQHVVCPTYYSFDPVLENVFGARPKDYWSLLSAGLPPQVGLFWTGNQVISSSITEQDILRATKALGRKPLLWDNYPVNDGKKTASYLHLRPYSGRPSSLQQLAAGHLVNPMNQAYLSQLVLQSLQCIYRPEQCVETAWERGLFLLGNESLAKQLADNIELFQDGGLESLSENQRAELIFQYAQYTHPAAREVVSWLKGEYQFDPTCLTD